MAEPAGAPTLQTAGPEGESTLMNGVVIQPEDVVMADASTPQDTTSAIPTPLPTSIPPPAPAPAPAPQPSLQPTQAPPAPTHAPALSQPAQPTTSVPAPTSSRNSPHPTQQQAPTQPIPHGSPTRVYLNQHVTPHLLEAMKYLATTEPEKPLKWLSEFLAVKSVEIEGV